MVMLQQVVSSSMTNHMQNLALSSDNQNEQAEARQVNKGPQDEVWRPPQGGDDSGSPTGAAAEG